MHKSRDAPDAPPAEICVAREPQTGVTRFPPPPLKSVSSILHLSRFAARAVRVLLGVLVLWAPLARAQAPVDAEQAALRAKIHNEAMQAFQAGKWAEAAAGLEKLLAMITSPVEQSQLAPVYYTLCAAYFNAPDFPKAIESFNLFLTKFPGHEKVTEIKMSLGQAYVQVKKYPDAIKQFQALEAIPALRDKALLAQMGVYKIQGKKEDVIKVLQKLAGGEITTTLQARGAIQLAELFADADEPDKAIAMLQKIATKTALIDNLVSLNTVAFKLGDAFLERQKYPQALGAYRSVKTRAEVLKFQKDRIAMIERRIEANKKTDPGNPQLYAQAQMQNKELKGLLEESQALLAEFEKTEDYASSLLFREARCWYDWDKKWEALVVYNRLLNRFPKAKEREPILYSTVITYADMHQVVSAQRACETYLKEFPDGPNAGTVGYMAGAVALEANDPAGAETFFGIMIQKQPNSQYKEEMQMLLGNAKFAQGKWDEAIVEYGKYLSSYPAGRNVEEVEYRVACTHVFQGKYEAALKELNGYVAKYPGGLYAPDAKYRTAVCFYAASQYDDVIKQCNAWLAEFAKDDMRGEVSSLLGDAFAAQNKNEEAAKAYVVGYKAATTDEVMNYSLFEASKQMQKAGQWEPMSFMFQEFVNEHPDHVAVVAALFWIGKAKAKLGHEEEAKTFLVDQLRKFINEPKREAVENILTQLAQLCAKRPRQPEPPPAPPKPAAPAPAPDAAKPDAPAPDAAPAEPVVPEPPPYDPYAELDKQLEPIAAIANNTGKARLLFARAELATLKKNPIEHEKVFADLAARFTTEDLSPVLLAYVGDYLKGKATPKNRERAGELYNHLKEDFLKSEYLDYAYVGLGDLAFIAGKYDKALELYNYALDTIGATFRLKEGMIGKAKALLELGKFEESKKLFEQIASIREWRGDTTAMAVFQLGEVELRQNKYPEAIAHYRRVFVAYQKYLPWVAKAYLKAAETFEKMGKREDAIENLREMLRNEKLEKMPEAEEARKKMQALGVSA